MNNYYSKLISVSNIFEYCIRSPSSYKFDLIDRETHFYQICSSPYAKAMGVVQLAVVKLIEVFCVTLIEHGLVVLEIYH